MNWALFGAFLFLFAAIVFLFSISAFSKVRIDNKPSLSHKILFRIVNGNEKTIKHEQRIYIKRARSLWRKEMRAWSTFRLYFPSKNNYGVFGIFVPNSFQIDEDCLTELGFVMGDLDYLKDTATIELPMWSKLGVKLNRLRSKAKLFATYGMSKPYGEFHDRKRHQQTFVMATGELNGLWTPK